MLPKQRLKIENTRALKWIIFIGVVGIIFFNVVEAKGIKLPKIKIFNLNLFLIILLSSYAFVFIGGFCKFVIGIYNEFFAISRAELIKYFRCPNCENQGGAIIRKAENVTEFPSPDTRIKKTVNPEKDWWVCRHCDNEVLFSLLSNNFTLNVKANADDANHNDSIKSSGPWQKLTRWLQNIINRITEK